MSPVINATVDTGKGSPHTQKPGNEHSHRFQCGNQMNQVPLAWQNSMSKWRVLSQCPADNDNNSDLLRAYAAKS